MVQVDLITGFLGSGKTTFMRHYARYMVQQGWNVCICLLYTSDAADE